MLNGLDLEGFPRETRVVVAMSGGVDSSVTAALLKAEGYDVVGVTLQLYDHGAATHRKGACCAGQDIYDARAVAERIGIPHYVLDYESRFKEMVIDRFAESYVAGETPVPCVDCNQSIKFHDLLATAQDLGARVLATGHYVASRALPDGSRALYRARDEDRDQSYFLFATTREQLAGADAALASCLLANLNSVVVDFCARQKISGRRLTPAGAARGCLRRTVHAQPAGVEGCAGQDCRASGGLAARGGGCGAGGAHVFRGGPGAHLRDSPADSRADP